MSHYVKFRVPSKFIFFVSSGKPDEMFKFSTDLEKIGIKRIIHATGPTGTMPNKAQLLRDAYQNSLQVACNNGLKSVAFPAISTAIFGYDINEATPVAFKAVKDFIEKHPGKLEEVRFVVRSDSDLTVYKKYEYLLRVQ